MGADAHGAVGPCLAMVVEACDLLTSQLHPRTGCCSGTDMLVCAIPGASRQQRATEGSRVAGLLQVCCWALELLWPGEQEDGCISVPAPALCGCLKSWGSRLTLVVLVYSAANVRSGKTGGMRGETSP